LATSTTAAAATSASRTRSAWLIEIHISSRAYTASSLQQALCLLPVDTVAQ
jgi:hypothetical protein